MKKLYFSVFFAVALLGFASGIQAQTATSPFAGNWMLDNEKTSRSKDFPEKLKNYKMAVDGNEAAIRVRSQVEGNVEMRAAGNGARTDVTESASRIRGGASSVSGTESSNTGKVNFGGTMAIFFTPNEAIYSLNGEEVKQENKDGFTRVKAKPDKSGKGVQFTTIRRLILPKGEMEVIIRESWKLSEDGKSLKLQRTVETPTARDEILMMLTKVG